MKRYPRIDSDIWLKKYPDAWVYPWDLGATKTIIRDFLDAGALKVELPDDEDVSEVYVTVPDPLSKALMVEMVEYRPDEFDEIEPNVFRLWKD